MEILQNFEPLNFHTPCDFDELDEATPGLYLADPSLIPFFFYQRLLPAKSNVPLTVYSSIRSV